MLALLDRMAVRVEEAILTVTDVTRELACAIMTSMTIPAEVCNALTTWRAVRFEAATRLRLEDLVRARELAALHDVALALVRAYGSANREKKFGELLAKYINASSGRDMQAEEWQVAHDDPRLAALNEASALAASHLVIEFERISAGV